MRGASAVVSVPSIRTRPESGREMVPMMSSRVVFPLPDAPENVKGMINLRGEIIPVYSLRSRFHMEEIEKTRDTQLLIAMADNIQIAFEVDQVIGIEMIEEENRREIPVVIRGEYQLPI